MKTTETSSNKSTDTLYGVAVEYINACNVRALIQELECIFRLFHTERFLEKWQYPESPLQGNQFQLMPKQ